MRTAGSPLWNPYLLTPSVLAAWWSADDHGTANMTDDGAGLISQWVDRLGATSATGATTARPTWASNSFNSSYAGLTFDGVANALTATTITAIPTGANPSAIFTFAFWNDVVSMRTFVVGSNTAGQDRRVGNDSSKRSFVGDGTTTLTNTGGSSTSSRYIISCNYMDGTTLFGFENGSPFSPTASTALVPATASTRLRLGATAGGSPANLFSGVMRHVIVTKTITTAQRQQIEGWLAWDVHLAQTLLPVTHPYYNSPP